jgi:hypothetical protein
MMPALLGYQNVVFDRSWLSEVPYGTVFRGGEDRLGDWQRRMLERIALRCGAIVIKCNPGWPKIKESFLTGREEMLENINQLEQVFLQYGRMKTDLPIIHFDYARQSFDDLVASWEMTEGGLVHPTSCNTAGSWDRDSITIVGESFTEPKEHDPLQQYPFVSFSNIDCSRWLTEHLIAHDVPEDRLFWVNADMPGLQYYLTGRTFITLGTPAAETCRKLGHTHFPTFCHPQAHKRFYSGVEYGLGPFINKLLGEQDEAMA